MVETSLLILSFHSEGILSYFASLSTVLSHHSSLKTFLSTSREQQRYLGLH